MANYGVEEERERKEIGEAKVKANNKRFAEKRKRALAKKIGESPRKAHLIEGSYMRPK